MLCWLMKGYFIESFPKVTHFDTHPPCPPQSFKYYYKQRNQISERVGILFILYSQSALYLGQDLKPFSLESSSFLDFPQYETETKLIFKVLWKNKQHTEKHSLKVLKHFRNISHGFPP